MKKKIEKIYSLILIALIYFICIAISIYALVKFNPHDLTHIEKFIKKHNSVKENIANPKFQIIQKPASSQSTVFNGDSVRVIPKLYKEINIDSLNNDPEVLDWFIDEGELYIYTKKDSIEDEIERLNYINNLK
jgi:hypothetical protein|tara:strand:- start:4610 stop:5008 length:399 start_codon:yes stop_codon:yes gene_type:complete